MSAVRRHVKSKRGERHRVRTTHRATNVGNNPTPLKHLTHLSRNQSTFLSQIRCNECPDLGRLAHRIGTSMVESCRWCCPEEHKAAAPAVPRISAARSVDPCKCPYCDEVISTRPNCLKHCLRWHTEIPEEEARRKLNCVKAKKEGEKGRRKKRRRKRANPKQQLRVSNRNQRANHQPLFIVLTPSAQINSQQRQQADSHAMSTAHIPP